MENKSAINKDPEIWKIAQKRAGFKRHAIVYLIVNSFLWLIYFMNSSNVFRGNLNEMDNVPWPVWPMFGWGIGLVFNYLSAYHQRDSLTEKEYNKLKNTL